MTPFHSDDLQRLRFQVRRELKSQAGRVRLGTPLVSVALLNLVFNHLVRNLAAQQLFCQPASCKTDLVAAERRAPPCPTCDTFDLQVLSPRS